MSDSQAYNANQEALIKLLQDKLDNQLTKVEKENQEQENTLNSLKSELDRLLEVGTHCLAEFEEKEPSIHGEANLKGGLSIDIDDDHTPSSKGGQNVPQTTKEAKTGLLTGRSGKSDNPKSMNDISEEKKTNQPIRPEKKHVPGSTPKINTKGNEKPAIPKVEPKFGRKPPNKKPEPTKPKGAEEKKEESKQEKSPEQTAVDQALNSFKTISKKLIIDLGDSLKVNEPAAKVIEAVCIIVGEKNDIESAKKFLKTGDVVKKLQSVNAETITEEHYNQVKELLKDQSETTKFKNGSTTSFLKWANRIIKLHETKKGIQPKVETTAEETNGEHKADTKEEEKIEHKPETESVQTTQEEVKTNIENASTETSSESKEGIISKEDIAALKAKRNPPAPVNAVLDATCVALKIAPKTIGGRKTYDHTALLNTQDLQNKINSLNVTTVSKDTIKKLKEFTDKPDFKVEKVQSVPGAANLCKWILSIIEHDKSTSSDANVSTESKDAKPAADKGTKRPPTAITKKEEKKVEEKKEEKGKDVKKIEKKDDKKPLATPAQQKTQKPPVQKEEKKTAAPLKGTEAKKEDKTEGSPVKVLQSINAKDINELKGLAKPPEPILKLFQAISLLLQNKEFPWNHYQKEFIPNLIQKLTDLNINNLPKDNVQSSQKFVTDNHLDETSLRKSSKAAGLLFKWLESTLKFLEKPQEKVEENPDATQQETETTESKEAKEAVESKEIEQNKEAEQKEESNKETEENVKESEEKIKESEEVHAPNSQETEQIEVPQTNGTKEASPRASQKFEELESTEVQPVEKTQTNEEPQINYYQPEEQTGNKEEEQKIEEKTNGTENYDEAKKDLNEILGYDVSAEIEGDNVKDFINQKVTDIENQISVINNQNEDLRKEGVQENPEKKPYEIKESTKGFIEMVEEGWLKELLEKPEWDEKICQILVLFFNIQGIVDVPDFNDRDALKTYTSEKLKSKEANLVEYLLGVGKDLDIDISLKIKIQEFLRDKASLLVPTTFDGVDGLCGVISFLMKEVCEYLGVLPMEIVKKTSVKEKIYLLNLEKVEFYNQRQNKVIEVAHKHNIPLDSES